MQTVSIHTESTGETPTTPMFAGPVLLEGAPTVFARSAPPPPLPRARAELRRSRWLAEVLGSRLLAAAVGGMIVAAGVTAARLVAHAPQVQAAAPVAAVNAALPTGMQGFTVGSSASEESVRVVELDEKQPTAPAPEVTRTKPSTVTGFEAFTQQGDQAATAKQWALASARYQQALVENEFYLPARLGVADVAWASGDRGAARQAYQYVLAHYPDDLIPERARQRSAMPAGLVDW